MHELVIDMPNNGGWRTAAIGDVCELVSRGTAPIYVDRSEVRAIGQRCVTMAGFTAQHARGHSANSMPNTLLARPGDVLLNSTGTGTIGRSCVFNEDGRFIVDGHVTALRPAKDVLDSKWLNALLSSTWGQRHIERYCFSGSTNQVELNRSPLIATQIPLPPINEQRAFAKVLDTLDTTIRQTEAIIEKLKQVKQGLLHDLLTRGIDANGELRPPQSEAPHLYKASPLGWIPVGWETTRLGGLLKVQLGFAFRSEDYVERGLLNFRVANIGRDGTDLGSAAYLPEHFWDAFPNQQLIGGEIVIVMVGATTGKLGRVPHELCPALQNQNMWNLVPLAGINREFLWHLLPGAVARHLALAQGSARDFLTQAAFLATECLRPTEAEQDRIVSKLKEMDASIRANDLSAEKLRLLRSGLMDDLLTGRIRVTPLLQDRGQSSPEGTT